MAGLGGLLLFTWGGFVLFAMNEERLSSSVVKRVLGGVSSHESIRGLLGDGIALEPAWFLMGTPRIGGQVESRAPPHARSHPLTQPAPQINLLQGNVDVRTVLYLSTLNKTDLCFRSSSGYAAPKVRISTITSHWNSTHNASPQGAVPYTLVA